MTILSVPIDVVTMEQAVRKVQGLFAEPGLHIVATANAEMLMRASRDKELHDILTGASLVIPDGAGVLWAAEQEGKHFPERVTGCDLMVNLLKEAALDGTPVYFLGAAPGVAEQAVQRAEAAVGKLNVAGIHSGFFDQKEEEEIVQTITDKKVKLVFAALGVPKQEKWLTSRLGHLSGIVGIGVGGSFDVLAGNVARAPHWMQRNRLEWLYRLYRQPSRLSRMAALPKFVLAVWRDKK